VKSVFIIPARSGSKGIPNKNLKLINGIPMFVWSIIHASFIANNEDYIIVSSESDHYLEIAKRWGATPVKRPLELAKDTTLTEPVMTDAISNINLDFDDNIVLLQPTSPLRSKELMISLKKKLNTSLSAVSLTESYEFNWIRTDENLVKPLYKDRPRRQDMIPKLSENGSIYFTKYKLYKNQQNRVHKKADPLILNIYESIEIDNIEELKIVNSISKTFNKEWLKEVFNGIKIKNVFLDIDGVFAKNIKSSSSNDRFYSTQDSNTIRKIIRNDINVVLISSEKNTHSNELFNKVGLKKVYFGVENKLEFIKEYIKNNKLNKKESVFMGNDSQDIECLKYFDFSAVPDDANKSVKKYAKFIIDKPGGNGAITELSNLIFN